MHPTQARFRERPNADVLYACRSRLAQPRIVATILAASLPNSLSLNADVQLKRRPSWAQFLSDTKLQHGDQKRS